MGRLLIIIGITLASLASGAEHFTFIDASDIHVGKTSIFTAGEPSNNIVHLSSLNPAFILMTGDVADQSGVADTQAMVAITNSVSTPVWILPGNHDACPEFGGGGGDAGIDPCSESYTNYYFYINGGSTNAHWVKDYASFRFIGFDSRQIRGGGLDGFGKVEDYEFTWLTNEIYQAKLAVRNTVLCSHYPLVNDWGNNIKVHQTEILAAMQSASNVVAYLGGHRHQWGDHVTNNGTVHVNCPSLAYNTSTFDPPYSAQGGFFQVTVTNSLMRFQLYAADDPTYTIRPSVNFDIPYTPTASYTNVNLRGKSRVGGKTN